MYLPYKKADTAKIQSLVAQLFALILGEKIALDVVKKDVKLTFDPETEMLTDIEMPLYTKSEVARLSFRDGWPIEASVEDTKLAPGKHFTIYRNFGADWVSNGVVREVTDGDAKFVINAGDVVWWGYQGKTLEDSPYWQRMNDMLLSRLPAPDSELTEAGLNGRYFPAIGNHEVWDDPSIEGVLSATPYLKDMGVSADNMIYTYDFNWVRFITLWTGKADRHAASAWDATAPVYEKQLEQLKVWLDDAKAKDIKNVFVTFHNPVFNRSSFKPIPPKHNPHATFASYADDFEELVVFNGHVHTTEMYDVDGVKYFVLGSGGSEQDSILPGRQNLSSVPADYPKDLYWNGATLEEDYNYIVVDVTPGEESKFTVKRFRPTSATPFEEVELFTDSK
ncbi:hypothetical protein BV911_17170 [Pseudoruegeria sp. SK021]|nr:hypothetical protein BV911_17170 [Pseudoruegeria sp. SK021]